MIYRSPGALRGLLFAAIKLVATIGMSAAQLSAQTLPVPSPIAVRGQAPAVVLHAEGAQIYECEADEHSGWHGT